MTSVFQVNLIRNRIVELSFSYDDLRCYSHYLFDKLPLEDNPEAEAAWDHFVNDYAPKKDRAALREAHRKNQRLRRKGLL